MIGILIKNRLRSIISTMLGGRRNKGITRKGSVARAVIFVLLYLYLFGVISVTLCYTASWLSSKLIPIGASWMYFSVFMIISFSVSFLLGIFETKSELFECKDNELLLSMPIRPRDIVAARISVVMIYNGITNALIMIPCTVFYGIRTADAVGIAGAILTSLLILLLSVSLSSAVGFLVTLIAKRIGRNSFVSLALALAFIVVYMCGYSYVVTNLTSYFERIAETGIMPDDMPIIYHIGAAALLKPFNITILSAVSISFFALGYVLISRNYSKLISMNYGAKKMAYKGGDIRLRSPLFALVGKEMRKFVSSAIYMLNGGLGAVMAVIVGGFLVFKRSSLELVISFITDKFGVSESSALALAPLLVVFCLTTVTMSSSVLSLEGKNLWIPKTIPVSDRDVLISKVIPHIIVSAPASLIASVLVAIAVGAPMEYWFFFIVTPLISTVFFGIFGLMINVLLPKFEYTNEAEVVKQSLAVLVVMLTQMIIAFLICVGAVALCLLVSPIVVSLICLLAFFVLAVISYFILLGPIKRAYARISV